jgi:alpha-beta hydrolase superfamily lysophospholipase
MIHGVGCTGSAWDVYAPAFRARGYRVQTPTLKADLRVRANPSAALNAVTLEDYVDEAEGWARGIETDTGAVPILMGHSMGGLIVQKLMERGIGAAGVLVTPAAPAGVGKPSLPVVFTFANILFTSKSETKPHKVWRAGFDWGVLNCVPKARHDAIYAEAVYDSGLVYQALGSPAKDPHRTAFVDESRIAAPMLVIAGSLDRATPAANVRAVAAKYAGSGADLVEYSNHGHWIVDEPGSEQVIGDIAAWLEQQDL